MFGFFRACSLVRRPIKENSALQQGHDQLRFRGAVPPTRAGPQQGGGQD
jgi:hypothetical protein